MLANRTLQASANNTGYQILKSLRFRSAASAYLSRTATTLTDQQTFTFSFWAKCGNLGTTRPLYTCFTDSNNFFGFNFTSSDTLTIGVVVGGSTLISQTTVAVYRDPSAWYHIVLRIDTTQAVAANRVILEVNNVVQTFTAGTNPSQNANVHNWASRRIAANITPSNFFDGYLAEFNFVQGLALASSSFGQTEPVSGVWSAKRYIGTYGTNGFYLDFNDTTSVTNLGYDKSKLSRTFSAASTYVTSPTTYSFTVPTYSSSIVVTLWGGGGGGGGGGSTFGNSGSGGTASTFSTLSAGGGGGGTGAWTANPTGVSGAGGTATGGDTNTNGNSIATSNGATTGAGAPNGGGNTATATANAEHYNGTAPGGAATGGRWAGSGNPTGGAGGSGAYVQKTYAVGALTPGTVITVTVGGGGAGGASDADQGSTGASGRVMVSVDGIAAANDWTPTNINLDTTPRVFTSTGTTTWVAPAGTTSVQYLVVGGGGGGANWGGGGGAGGFRTGTLSVTPGSSYTVTVGAGGAGALSGGGDGSDGSNSVFDSITSTGGGGGAFNGAGKNGGSGGGASFSGAGGLGNTPSTSPSQGNNGGAGSGTIAYQGGGGGASAVGGSGGGGTSGAGGNGTASSITGVSVTYAGGGGGGGGLNAGGNWGGGAGGTGGGGAGSQSSTGANGTANTGGGGGGSGRSTNTFFDAGSGGSGIVVLSPSGSTPTYDSMLDVPLGTGVGERGNYATLNPLQRILVGTLTGGNLDGYAASSNMFRVATLDLQRDTYYECLNTANTRVGLVWLPIQDDGSNWFAASAAYVLLNSGGGLTTQNCSASQSVTPSYSTGNTLGLAWNSTARTLTLYVNGVLSTVVTVTSPTTYPHPLFANVSSGVATSFSVNFGQRPFSYTPPTGFLPLHTGNFSVPAIRKPNQHFDATLWRGDGVGGQLVTNSGNFLPDLVWMKGRNFGSAGQNNVLVDSVRGINIVLSSNLTNVQAAISSISAFSSNGFTTSGTADNGYSGSINNMPYVGWQWKAGGSAVSNTAGSITSQVSANTSSGFSVITYTGTGSNATVGHGLGVAPKMIIVKNRSNAAAWAVRHASLGTNDYLLLNLTNAVGTSATVFNGAPTSSVINIGTDIVTNSNTHTYVAYAFAEVEGYSKIGSYAGNGSTDGPFVYCGFRPKYVMIKKSTGGVNANTGWVIFDSARNTANVTQEIVRADLADAESSGYLMDFVANGFKLRLSTIEVNNASSDQHIFIAFAEAPLKNSLAR